MTVKEFVGLCADRNMEVIITDRIGRKIANGSAMEVFTNEMEVITDNMIFIDKQMTREELLKSKVGCFYCNNNKLRITLE